MKTLYETTGSITDINTLLISKGEYSNVMGNADRMQSEIDELRKALYESKHCQCGYDDVCAFALEAEKLRAELARYTPVGYLEKHHLDGDRDIRLCNLTASPVWGDMVQIFIAKEKTE
jgi:hypothetical protein